MSEPQSTPTRPRPRSPLTVSPTDDNILGERCGAEIYRFHAVSRWTERGW